MKLTFAFLNVFVFVNYAFAGTCVQKEMDDCIKAMTETLEDGQPRAACRAVKNVKDCYQRTIDKCADELANKVLEKNIEELNENIKIACTVTPTDADDDNDNDFTDDERNTLECFKDKSSFMPFLSQCTRQTWKESRGNVSFGITPEDVGCNYFVAYARCVSRKVGDFCGESFEQLLYHQIILAWKGLDRRATKSPVCAKAKEEATEHLRRNSRKRRSLADIAFEKFLP